MRLRRSGVEVMRVLLRRHARWSLLARTCPRAGALRCERKLGGRRQTLLTEVVFATANITSADPAGRLGAKAIGTNCTGCMAEMEMMFDRAGFDAISVQKGRMPQSTVLQGSV